MAPITRLFLPCILVLSFLIGAPPSTLATSPLISELADAVVEEDVAAVELLLGRLGPPDAHERVDLSFLLRGAVYGAMLSADSVETFASRETTNLRRKAQASIQASLTIARLLIAAGGDPDFRGDDDEPGERTARERARYIQQRYGISDFISALNAPAVPPRSVPATKTPAPSAGETPWVAFVSAVPEGWGTTTYYGVAWGARSRDAAVQRATRECLDRGGGHDCSFGANETSEAHQSQCIAVAQGKYTMTDSGRGISFRVVNYYASYSAHETRAGAEHEVLQDCRRHMNSNASSCHIVDGGCAR